MSREITNRNVFILGAGFSKAAGAPLVHDFLDKAREFYDDPESRLDEQERDHFRSVFAFKQEMSRAREKMMIDLDNIEHLFGLVEMHQRLKKVDPGTRDSTIYLIAKTLQLALEPPRRRPRIGFELNGEVGDDSSFPQEVERDRVNNRYFADIYDFFAGLVSGCYDRQDKCQSRNTSIITFNYDLVLDDALWRIGYFPEYHLPRAELEAPGGPRRISLLKLHGSTNWAVCRNCAHVVVRYSKLTSFPSELRSQECTRCKKSGLQLLLVPPSWDKTEYQGLMRSVWEKAAEALNSATRICIIGYSMPEADAFFRYLLTLGLADNHQLYKLIVVNREHQLRTPAELTFETGGHCMLEEMLRGQNDEAQTIEGRYRALFESTFAQRRFRFHGDGLELYLGNGEAFGELGRGELICNPHLY